VSGGRGVWGGELNKAMFACTGSCCDRHPGACLEARHDVSRRQPQTVYHRQSHHHLEDAFWLARADVSRRVAALATHRSVSDADISFAARTRPGACFAALVMLENRPLTNASHYWTKVIALNYLYASRHGYGFLLMAPRRSGSGAKGVYYSWCKIWTLARLVERFARPAASCTWLVFLDSDAYVREQLVSVPALLASLGPAAEGAQLVLGRENSLHDVAGDDVHFSTAFALNTGVLFMMASNWSLALLKAWGSLENGPCSGKLFRRQAEQKCFERLLTDQRHLLPPAAEQRILHVPMQAFNSPWGRYVRHIWGGEGVRLRATVYDDELRVQGVWTAAQQMALVERAYRVGNERTC
jgi:hypothetical protein